MGNAQGVDFRALKEMVAGVDAAGAKTRVR
jgi:hypothetical protein